MKRFLFFLSIFINVSLNAQQWQWAKSISYGAQAYGTSISADQNKNVYVTGTSSYYSGGGGSYSYDLFWKFDPLGNTIWTDTLPFSVTRSICDLNGNTYMAGTKLAKYNSSGNVEWSFTLPFSGFYRDMVLFPSGGIILVGRALIGGTTQSVLSRYDENGNLVWSRFNDFEARGSDPNSISCSSDGTIYWAGQDATADSSWSFLAKVDPAGNLLSTMIMPYGVKDIATGTDNSVYVMGAFSNPAIYINDTMYQFSTTHYYYIKYNFSNEVSWYKIISGQLGSNAITTDLNGNSYLTISHGALSVDSYTATYAGFSILKLNEAGNIEWIKHSVNTGTFGAAHTRAIAIGTDNEVLTTGSINGQNSFDDISVTSSSSYTDLFVGKVSVNVISVEEQEQNSRLLVFPNPGQGICRINYTTSGNSRIDIKVLNSAGKEVYSQNLEQAQQTLDIQINLNGVANGIYYVQINEGDKRIVRKLIVN
jgi:hypothetical protein